MDTQTRPSWAEIGKVVHILEWFGLVVDVSVTDTGKLFVLVDSPKAYYHMHSPEWLEYHPELPNLIREATVDQLSKDAHKYSDRLLARQRSMLALVENAKAN